MIHWKKSLAPAKPIRAKPRKLEDPIHVLVFGWLVSNIDGIVYHCPNGYDGGSEVVFIRGKPIPRAAIMWQKLVKMGARAGVPDLTIHWAGADGIGRTAYFEIKSDGGRLNENQKDFMSDLDRCRIPHRVIRSLSECRMAVAEIGIPLQSSSSAVSACS